MARYWVGGTGNWKDTANWSTTNGGGGGAAVPTSSDDVFITSLSGFGAGGTITLDGAYYDCVCHDFTSSSGHSYTLGYDGSDLSIYGSAIFESGITLSGVWIYFLSNSSETVESNGLTFGNNNELYFGYDDDALYTTGTWTLQDDLVSTDEIYIYSGTFDANDNDVTAHHMGIFTDTDAITVIMGSGVWTVNHLEVYDGDVNTIVTPETSTIKVNGSFYGSYNTYHDIWFTGNSTMGGSNTFNDFKIDANVSVTFEYFSTQVVSSLTATGSGGNLITLDSIEGGKRIATSSLNAGGSGWAEGNNFYGYDTGGNYFNGTVTGVNAGAVTTFTITYAGYDMTASNAIACTKSGAGGTGLKINILTVTPSEKQFHILKQTGTVTCDYLDIHNSHVGGGATWVAGDNSLDGGGNSGWFDAGERYWVGGSGDWSNAAHWSLTSGGASGASIPSPSDNVIIDENSGLVDGSVITIDEDSTCFNITSTAGCSYVIRS